MFRFLILFVFPGIPWLWWLLTDLELRRLPRVRKWQRAALLVFVMSQTAIFAAVLLARGEFPQLDPNRPLTAATYIWHLVVAPAAFLAMVGLWLARGVARVALKLRARPAPAVAAEPADHSPRVTRRELFAGTLAAAPPLIMAGATIRSIEQLNHFRIRELEVRIPTLPAALDGVRIAHLTDFHVGKFTTGKVLREITAATNDLGADLVLFTGDLIDHSMEAMPEALRALERLKQGSGLVLCEGNHDLFEDRDGFESGVRRAGFNLLLNEATEVKIRGERVQLLGLKWGKVGAGRDAMFASHLAAIRPLLNPEAFPILLAHHPHAFDGAAAAGILLTLSGHTHGGQLMLTPGIGAGPAMYRYWSGLYRKGAASLVVSNGTGNWFPLRINAPAEIVHITLRKG